MREVKSDDVAAQRHIPPDGLIVDVALHRVVNRCEVLGRDFLGEIFKRGLGPGVAVFQGGTRIIKVAAVVAENLAA